MTESLSWVSDQRILKWRMDSFQLDFKSSHKTLDRVCEFELLKEAVD